MSLLIWSTCIFWDSSCLIVMTWLIIKYINWFSWKLLFACLFGGNSWDPNIGKTKQDKQKTIKQYFFVLWKEVKTLFCFATYLATEMRSFQALRLLPLFSFSSFFFKLRFNHFRSWKYKVLHKLQNKNWKCRFPSIRTSRIKDTKWKCMRALPTWVQIPGCQSRISALQEHKRKKLAIE